MLPRQIIGQFDTFLTHRGLLLDAVVIGGTALALLGIISRETRDCDVLHPHLSDELRAAAGDFAVERRAHGDALAGDWLNNGPLSLVDVRPDGWQTRTHVMFAGRAVTLRSLGRSDLLRTKLFALCDRGIDLGDCIALRPSSTELEDITPWLEVRDLHPDWPAHVRVTMQDLQRRLENGL